MPDPKGDSKVGRCPKCGGWMWRGKCPIHGRLEEQ